MPRSLFRQFFLVAAALSFLSCAAKVSVENGGPAKGTITVLDSGGPNGDTGWWPSLALDANDQPHLSYCDAYHGNLLYATKVKGKWVKEIIMEEGAVGKYTSIGVAPNGTIGIGFYDQDLKYLRYTWKIPGGKWESEHVAWGLEVGMASELRFDSQNRPHLFYYLPSGKLAHGVRNLKGIWQKTIIHESTGGFTVRIDPHLRDDGIWLSFVDWGFKDTTLFVGRATSQKPDKFAVETIFDQQGPGWRSQLVFDGPNPSLLYSLNFHRSLQIAKKENGEWKTKLLLRNAGNFVAKLSSQNGMVVAAESIENPKLLGGILYLLKRKNGKWKQHLVDNEGPNASSLSMVVTQQGKVIIAYYSKVIKGLKIYDETVLEKAN